MAPGRVIDCLPPHLEATEPPEARGLRRDHVRLLVSQVQSDRIGHARFDALPQWLAPGDVLVVNTSATLPAALTARDPSGAECELHLSTEMPGGFWVVEVRRPGRVRSEPWLDACEGTRLELAEGGSVILLSPYPAPRALRASSRLWLAALQLDAPVVEFLERHGQPIRYGYVPRSWPRSMYQTVFATEPGSAEMPSAGRPFTTELVTRLVSCGVQVAPVLLHAGVASLEDSEPPYEEYFRVSPEAAALVTAARRSGHRVVAVGTTAVRAIETVTDSRGTTTPGEGWTSLVITRDRPLRAVNGLITGLHEPKATHLAIVAQAIAAAGGVNPGAHLARAYEAARDLGYLWHEFGDSHLIIDTDGMPACCSRRPIGCCSVGTSSTSLD